MLILLTVVLMKIQPFVPVSTTWNFLGPIAVVGLWLAISFSSSSSISSELSSFTVLASFINNRVASNNEILYSNYYLWQNMLKLRKVVNLIKIIYSLNWKSNLNWLKTYPQKLTKWVHKTIEYYCELHFRQNSLRDTWFTYGTWRRCVLYCTLDIVIEDLMNDL